jgi:hypothetical protein
VRLGAGEAAEGEQEEAVGAAARSAAAAEPARDDDRRGRAGGAGGEALRERLAGRGFTVLVEAPFVVAGDEAADKVESRAASTIRWSVKYFKKQYFAADPREIVEVYLFRDAVSYMHHAKLLFDDEPETPYGYYTPTHDALLMNISSGGGTLVHEIVPPVHGGELPGVPDVVQ